MSQFAWDWWYLYWPWICKFSLQFAATKEVIWGHLQSTTTAQTISTSETSWTKNQTVWFQVQPRWWNSGKPYPTWNTHACRVLRKLCLVTSRNKSYDTWTGTGSSRVCTNHPHLLGACYILLYRFSHPSTSFPHLPGESPSSVIQGAKWRRFHRTRSCHLQGPWPESPARFPWWNHRSIYQKSLRNSS